jgi:hypothetical protein
VWWEAHRNGEEASDSQQADEGTNKVVIRIKAVGWQLEAFDKIDVAVTGRAEKKNARG